MPPEHNRRATPRKALRRPAEVEFRGATHRLQTWDLGRDGLCLLSAKPIAPGTRCKVTFEIPVGSDVVGVTAAAKVVYSSYSAPGEFKIGAVFTDLGDDTALVLGRFASGS